MKRLYWTDPDIEEIEVQVETVGDSRVTTDPILFHPEEGGQPADTGTIGPARVCQVEVADGRVVHTLDQPLADGTYLARLDAERRRCTAAQHTAQHILSGIAARHFGLETTGVHIGLEGCTVDFDKQIDWDVAEELERQALEIVTSDLTVETVFDDDTPVRSRFGAIDADVVRVVKIGTVDASACCGAHVASTGRIGLIRIFNLEKKKEGTRASFVAGRPALEQSQSETSILRELRKAASCSNPELPSILAKSLERSKELAKEVNRLWTLRLSDLAEAADVVSVYASKVGIYVGELPGELAATLAGLMAEAVDGAGVVVAGMQIAISSRTLDARGLFTDIRNEIGAKGGGSPRAANGRLNRPMTKDELVAILENHSHA